MVWTKSSLQDVYPHLFALALNPEAILADYWDNTYWCPILVGYLFDQRVEDLAALQQSLLHLCLVSRAPDGWVWSSCPFSIQNFYRQLRENQLGAVLEATQSYRLIWRQKIPLKLSIFGWLLVQNRLVTRVTRQRISPASLADCSMCFTRLEDCSHLLFECLAAWAVWAAQSILWAVTLSEESFWDSLRTSHGVWSSVCSPVGYLAAPQ